MNSDSERESFGGLNNDKGFVLVVSLMLLVVLTLIGTVAVQTSIFEVQIAGNDKVAHSSFYKADGGTEVAVLMTEENLSCPTGFSGVLAAGQFKQYQGVDVYDLRFAYALAATNVPGMTSPVTLDKYSTNTARSLRVPLDSLSLDAAKDANPHTNLTVFGTTQLSPGSAIQMSAGYEGKGHGAAGGGALIAENIYSRHMGLVNSQAFLQMEWKHVIGQEGTCRY